MPSPVDVFDERAAKRLPAFDEPLCDEVGQGGVELLGPEAEACGDVLSGEVHVFASGLELGDCAEHGEFAVRVVAWRCGRRGVAVPRDLSVEQPGPLAHVSEEAPDP